MNMVIFLQSNGFASVFVDGERANDLCGNLCVTPLVQRLVEELGVEFYTDVDKRALSHDGYWIGSLTEVNRRRTQIEQLEEEVRISKATLMEAQNQLRKFDD